MAGKTMVLLHGFPLDGTSWEPQRAALEAAGHRVLTPHLPGFGDPAAPALAGESCSMEGFARVVRDLIVGEAGGRAVVGGLSMGGYVLMALLRDFPETVEAAIFLDTKAEADSAEARSGRLKMIGEVRKHGTEAAVETMLGRVLSPGASEALKQQVRTIMRRQAVEAVCGAQWAMAYRRDQRAVLAALRVPALFVVGDADALTPPALMRALAERTAGGQFVEIAGAGHQSNLEKPVEVSAALAAFVAQL